MTQSSYTNADSVHFICPQFIPYVLCAPYGDEIVPPCIIYNVGLRGKKVSMLDLLLDMAQHRPSDARNIWLLLALIYNVGTR